MIQWFMFWQDIAQLFQEISSGLERCKDHQGVLANVDTQSPVLRKNLWFSQTSMSLIN